MQGLRFISQVLYRLKRRYGMPVDFLYRISSTVDRETGEKDVVSGNARVNRAIVLPSQIHREFFYDLTFIASNKNFTYGGHLDTTQRRVIVDRADLDFEIKVGYWMVIDGVRYDVREVEEFEHRRAYMVLGKQNLAAESFNVLDLHLISEITLTDTVAFFLGAPTVIVMELVSELTLDGTGEGVIGPWMTSQLSYARLGLLRLGSNE